MRDSNKKEFSILFFFFFSSEKQIEWGKLNLVITLFHFFYDGVTEKTVNILERKSKLG